MATIAAMPRREDPFAIGTVLGNSQRQTLDDAVAAKIRDFMVNKAKPPKNWDAGAAQEFRRMHFQRTGRTIQSKRKSFPFSGLWEGGEDNKTFQYEIVSATEEDSQMKWTSQMKGVNTVNDDKLKQIFYQMITETFQQAEYVPAGLKATSGSDLQLTPAHFMYKTEEIQSIPLVGNPLAPEQKQVLEEIRMLYLQHVYAQSPAKVQTLTEQEKQRKKRLEAYKPAIKMFYRNREVEHFEKALANKDLPYIQLCVDRPAGTATDLDNPVSLDNDVKESITRYMTHLQKKLDEQKKCLSVCIQQEADQWKEYFETGRNIPRRTKYITNPSQLDMDNGVVKAKQYVEQCKLAIFRNQLWGEWQKFARTKAAVYEKSLSTLQRAAEYEVTDYDTRKDSCKDYQNKRAGLLGAVDDQARRRQEASALERQAQAARQLRQQEMKAFAAQEARLAQQAQALRQQQMKLMAYSPASSVGSPLKRSHEQLMAYSPVSDSDSPMRQNIPNIAYSPMSNASSSPTSTASESGSPVRLKRTSARLAAPSPMTDASVSPTSTASESGSPMRLTRTSTRLKSLAAPSPMSDASVSPTSTASESGSPVRLKRTSARLAARSPMSDASASPTSTASESGSPVKPVMIRTRAKKAHSAPNAKPAVISIEYDDISDTEVAQLEQAMNDTLNDDLEHYNANKPYVKTATDYDSSSSSDGVAKATSYDSSSSSDGVVKLTSYDSSSDDGVNLKASAYDSTSDAPSTMNLASYDSSSDGGSETNLAYISSSSDSESDSGRRRSRRLRGKAAKVSYDSEFSETELKKLIYESGSDSGRSDTNAPYHSESDSDLDGI